MGSIYYRTGAGIPLFYIDGTPIYSSTGDYDPQYLTKLVCNPARGYTESSEQLVTSTRNANGQVVAQTINRRLNKFDQLKWPVMTREEVVWLKQKIANFTCKLTYYDSEADGLVTRKYYWGDFSAEPFEWEVVQTSGGTYYKRPSAYKDVSVNLIDMGY